MTHPHRRRHVLTRHAEYDGMEGAMAEPEDPIGTQAEGYEQPSDDMGDFRSALAKALKGIELGETKLSKLNRRSATPSNKMMVPESRPSFTMLGGADDEQRGRFRYG